MSALRKPSLDRYPRNTSVIFFGLFLLRLASLLRAESDQVTGVLRLNDGQYVSGSMLRSSDDNQITWRHPQLDGDLTIDIRELRRIDTGLAGSVSKTSGFAFELSDGSCLMGNFLGSQESTLTIECAAFGQTNIPISELARVRRLSVPTRVLKAGIEKPTEPLDTTEANGWEHVGASLNTTQRGARWREPIQAPERLRIDMRLSWSNTPNFKISFQEDRSGKPVEHLPQIEVWDRTVVAIYESNDHLDLAKLWELNEFDSDFACSMYWDRKANSIAFYSNTGAYLASLSTRLDVHQTIQAVEFYNYGSDLRIQTWVLSDWDGKLPYPPKLDSENEGTAVHGVGRIEGLSRDRTKLQYQSEAGETKSIDLTRLESFVQDSVQPSATKNTRKENSETDPNVVQVLLSDGSLITGVIDKAEPGFIGLVTCRGKISVACRVAQIVSVRLVYPVETPTPVILNRVRLTMPGVDLFGTLDLSFNATNNSRLRIQPFSSASSVGLRDDAKGSIYVMRSNIQPQTRPWRPEEQADGINVVDPQIARVVPLEANQGNQTGISPFRTPQDLRLRSGDVLSASIQSIDEKGITIESNVTSVHSIPHNAMYSAQLNNPIRGVAIDPQKMERLLTVPRFHRENPPTHLIITTQGDYIRGHLKQVTKDSVEFEESGAPIQIPRGLVAVILWLHERSWDESQPPIQAIDANTFYVHVRTRTSNSFTFQPERFEKQILYGRSPLLGSVAVPWSTIDDMYFGKEIQSMLKKASTNPWRLAMAKAPKVFEDSASESPMELGTDSPLVGQPAPNFELKTLDGQPWRLGNQKGKIVVLDFWASWCGPCMHGMPIIEGIVRESKRDDCMWVGVNIEESELRARTALERLQINSLVVLDELGGVAKEYQADAIPFTVIIDKKGVIHRVFVGIDDSSFEQISATLQAME